MSTPTAEELLDEVWDWESTPALRHFAQRLATALAKVERLQSSEHCSWKDCSDRRHALRQRAEAAEAERDEMRQTVFAQAEHAEKMRGCWLHWMDRANDAEAKLSEAQQREAAFLARIAELER